MRSPKLLLLFTLLFIVSNRTLAQKPNEYKQYRVLILLDGSSSMVENWGQGKTRFKEAGAIILGLMDSIYQMNNQVEFGLRVYGNQHGVPENNCYDTRREVSFSKDNYTQMSLRLEDLHPLGVSPIAFSLKTAAEEDFGDENNYSYSLILITDGGESCGGDICAVVKNLLDRKVQFKPYIVSLVDYAPLRDLYACLGNYLLASKPEQVRQAIGTIAESYRRVLKVPVLKTKEIATAKIPTPSVLKIDVPPVTVKKDPEPPAPKPMVKEPETKPIPKPEKTQITGIQPRKQETPKQELPKPQISNEKPAPNTSKIVVDQSDFVKENISSIPSRKNRIYIPGYYATIVTLNKKPVPPIVPIKKEPEPVAPVVQTPPPPVKKTPEVAPIKPKPVQPVATKKPETTTPQKEAVFTAIKEPSSETTLEVYFTDGKGKYYQTTPPVVVVDQKTGKEIKKFYRTVDASGNPDPQKLPAGTFSLVIGKDQNYVAKNVNITEGNKNRITIISTKGVLSFSYENNFKRPVSEFTATVKRNFDIAPIVTQRCNTEIDYEPGNYHIEINTLPITRSNIDMDFGSAYRIDIAEPGYVEFTNENPVGKVSLYYQLGDQYLRFYIMDVTGDRQAQKLRLQPGPYEAHFKRNPNAVQDIVISFVVRSNETTQVLLQ